MVQFKKVTNHVKSLLERNLVSLIVFGSVARRDNNVNSDVDLIIVVKNKTKNVINQIALLENKLSINSNNFVEKRIAKFLNLVGFKKSLFLFDEKEFLNKKFNFCDSKILAKLLLPKGIIWKAVHDEGKVIYGKNLLNFKPRITVWDKIKAPLPGIGACAFATFIYPFAKDKAVLLAQTGLRWTYMNVSGLLKRSNIPTVFGNFVEILKITFKNSPKYN
jgi:predicted nucleotidyltransferase